MTGVIDDGDVGIARGVGKIPECAAHGVAAHVVLGLDHVETGIAEQRGDGGGVILRIGQAPHIDVVRIADHQRNALIGQRPHGQQQAGGQKRQEPGLDCVHVGDSLAFAAMTRTVIL